MLEKAIEKLKTEMEDKKANDYIKYMGEYLIKYLTINTQAAEKVLQDGKTIRASLEEMKKVARGKAIGGWLMLTDQEGYDIVLEYFGIKGSGVVHIDMSAPVLKAPVAAEKKVFSLSLEDLM